MEENKEHLVSALAALMEDYGRAIDRDELERWPDFFEEQCNYKITSIDNEQSGYPFGVLCADSRGMLADRVKSLREANVYEGQRYRHVMGRPVVLSVDGPLIHAETSFLVVRTMRTGEMSMFAAGVYRDVVSLRASKPAFAERIVVCDSSRIDTLLALPL
ncbi:nuclear transport factor 2 family protein [Pigmentiphaga sp. GD03639]|jgi:3-phenylpropionate/cinnamic acid dioxygenase small subunit|uniref:Aromatic-ring-hydroxylating dioxygenase subunit beta n=1 Tax=Pigmentiphaga daeguensis TaxID=414049 RepID=A0ABN1BKZ3_9BURK|nr:MULTISPECIES: aromatic-ring-hydroxylating dioxygenase subunit beta [unclassified Pigmentiphaga]MDH2234955.1 nuclear transport factor 2 family protein [Pigmentiphaga sp. GD03639]